MKSKLFSTVLCLLLTLCCVLAISSCANQEAPAKCEHQFGEWVEKVEATCSKDGVLGHKICTLCNKVFDANDEELDSIVIASKNEKHSYKDSNPTLCTKCGEYREVKEIKQTNDKATVTFVDGEVLNFNLNLDSCPHKVFGKPYELIPHTLTEKGTYVEVCTCKDPNCNVAKIYEASICQMTEPKLVIQPDKNICEDGAVKISHCTICEKVVTDIIPAQADEGEDGQHTVAKWEETKAPTHTEEGEKVGYCTAENCGAKVAVAIPVVHSYQYGFVVSENGDEVEFKLVTTCSGCNLEATTETIAASDVKVTVQKPTCTAEGLTMYSVIAPNDFKLEASVTIPKAGHLYVDSKGTEALLEMEGVYDIKDYPEIEITAFDSAEVKCNETSANGTYLKKYFVCEDCGCVIPVWTYRSHTVEEYETVEEAKCNAGGKAVGTCTVGSDAHVTKDIPALGAEIEYFIVENAGTYTVNSKCVREENCDCTSTTLPAAFEVDVDDLIKENVKEATCASKGSYTLKYVDEENDIIATLEVTVGKTYHTLNGKLMDTNVSYIFSEVPGLNIYIDKPLDCKTPTPVYFTCEVCKDTAEVNALKLHTIATPVVVEPGCTTTGTATGTCSVCGDTDAVNVLPATGHSLKYTYNETEATLVYECSKCDYVEYTLTDVEKKTLTEATCTEDATYGYVGYDADGNYVTVTDKSFVEVGSAHGHEFYDIETDAAGNYPVTDKNVYVLDPDVELKCGDTTDGYIVCMHCNTHKRVTVYQPHVLGKDAEVAEEPTCTAGGTLAGACALCGKGVKEPLPATGHSYVYEVTVAPTATNPGEAVGTCACKDTVTEILPVLGTEDAYTVTTNVAATCTEKGEVKYTYKEIDTISFNVITDALGHKKCTCADNDHANCDAIVLSFSLTEDVSKYVGSDERADATVTYTVYECKNGCNQNILISKTFVYDGFEYNFDGEGNKTVTQLVTAPIDVPVAPLEEDFLFPAGTNAVIYKDMALSDDAQITHTENAVLGLSNVTAELDHDVIIRQSSGAIIIENSEFTLTDGAKLISVGEGGDAYQVFMVNVTINGVLMDSTTIWDYVEGVKYISIVSEWPN